MPAIVDFGEWLPDQPTLNNPGAIVATNVVPAAKGYLPFPSMTLFSTSMSARAIGAISARSNAGDAYNYVGESAALRQLVGLSWSAVTRLSGGAYTTAADDFWEFAQWNQTIIGVNGHTDLPQRISLGAANFANISGVAMPKAKHIAIVRDFVVLGNVIDSAVSAARVRWSAINSPFTTWSANAATLADYQDLPTEGGWVQRIVGGEYGVVFQERAITRMQFVGSPTIFQFDVVHRAIGAHAPQSVCSYQNLIFFLAEDGFYQFDGINLTAIGAGRVDKTFFLNVDKNYIHRVIGVADPISKCVLWGCPSNNANGTIDKLFLYNWQYNRWALVEGLDLEYFWKSLTGGYTLDGLDSVSTNLDLIPAPLDSRLWTGNLNVLAGINTAHRLNLFNGSDMPATVTTAEFSPYRDQDALAYITQVRPVVEGGSASFTVTLASRNSLVLSGSAITAQAPISRGTALVRRTARYHRASVTTNADFEHLVGVEVIVSPAGRR